MDLLTRQVPHGILPREGADMAAERVGTSVLFENGRVRVWEMVLAAGETCPAHGHAHDYLMLYTTPSVIASGPPGRQVVQQIEPGAVAYHAVGPDGLAPHSITNRGDADSHHFIVELLGPSEAATAQPVEHNGRGRILEPGSSAVRVTKAASTAHLELVRRAGQYGLGPVTGTRNCRHPFTAAGGKPAGRR